MNEQPASILLVDDIPENIQRAGAALLERGFRVSFADRGQKALELCQAKEFDLILLDIMMPEMDGFEVIERLKADEKTKEIPVIFLTAKTETEDLVKGFELGAVDYVTKPFNNQELLLRVDTHVLIQRQKMELKELNATKDKFFSIIAHDLKSPQNALLGLSELLLNQYEKFNDDERLEMIDAIFISAKNSTSLIEDLLTWARVQMGHDNFTPHPFSLFAEAEGILELYDQPAKAKSIELRIEVPKEANAFGDPAMIRAILRNFVSNALKFTPKGGSITLRAEAFDGQWKLEVADTGIGIKPENQVKLFRADLWHSTEGLEGESGTGLGLLICKEFAERNQGEIWVESELGQGSSFFVTLPSRE